MNRKRTEPIEYKVGDRALLSMKNLRFQVE